VYKVYVDSVQQDPTYLDFVCDYAAFVGTWKNREHLQHIKCAKHKPGFAKCDVCSDHAKQLKKKT
jgi:hypothetical protein